MRGAVRREEGVRGGRGRRSGGFCPLLTLFGRILGTVPPLSRRHCAEWPCARILIRRALQTGHPSGQAMRVEVTLFQAALVQRVGFEKSFSFGSQSRSRRSPMSVFLSSPKPIPRPHQQTTNLLQGWSTLLPQAAIVSCELSLPLVSLCIHWTSQR